MGRLCNGGAPFLLGLVTISDCWMKVGFIDASARDDTGERMHSGGDW
jgi:hypothetical protein